MGRPGLDQRTPSGQPAVTRLAVSRIVRHDRMGGLITNTTEPPRDRNQAFLTAHPIASKKLGEAWYP